ncbi:MAG: hypothetical protein IPO48_13265 [Saprospiraceae bacterium]|nr:hypothetical protein [Saprospiraceae bacterium]
MKNLSILKIFFGIIFTTLSYFNEISAQTIFEKEAQIRDSLFNLYIDADWCHTSKIPQNQKEPENFNDNRISLFKPHNFRGNSRNSTWNYTQGYGSTCENDCVMAAPIVCSNSSNSKFRIPVVFTVSTTVGCAGNAAPTQAEVDAQLAIMNDLYACEATPIEFYKSVSYTGHPSSGDMSTRFLNLGCIYDENNVSNIPGVTNIYVFSNTGNGTGCNGYAFLPSGPTAPMTAVMSNACFTGFVYTSGSLNCAAPSLGSGVVLIHEMGHYLGLEHTHGSYVPGPNVNFPGNGGNNTATNNYYGDISTELVNGSNSCTTGDHISDTPADLGISHSIDPQGSPSGTPPVVPNPVGGCATRSGCNITFTCQDANSQIYMPAANNIMNYNNISGCRTNYSDCQNAKMLDALICARGPQFCDRNVVAEFGSNPTTYNICIGDAAPTFTATSNCYKWMDGLGDAATQLATGTTTFTPAIGTGSGQLNNMLPGTYTWYLGDVNELNPNCRTPITVVVSAETGTATINNSSSANICGSQNINLATDVSVLGTNQIIGWWFSGSPLPSFSNQTSLDNAVAAATIGGPLSFPLNHIIASTSGSPLNQLTQSFDCSGLNGNTYYVTPIVATQNVPAPTSYSFALNGQSNISSTVNNLPVNVSQLPTNATLTSVCVQISYNACEVFATHNDLDISLMGPNGMTIVLEDFFAGSTNVPTPSIFNVCFVDNGTGYTGASSTGCNASCFSGNLESASSFSSFDGVNPNGTWTLIVNDDFNASFYPCNISVSLNFDMPSYALTFPSPVYTNCVIGSPVTVNCLCASCPTLTSAPANVTIMNSACSTGCTVSGGNIMAPSGTPCPTGSTLEYRVNGGAWSTTLPVYAQTGPAQTIETRCVCDTDNTMFSPSSAAMTTVPGTCTNPTAAITVAETSGTTNNDGNICAGASATLTASGGTSYIWSTAATTAGISVTPTGTTTYTVTVTNTNGCTDTEVTTITVNPLPTAAISIAETSGTTNNDGIICTGATSTLTASGGTIYVWSTAATTAGISVTPTGTTTPVTVTNTNGCTDEVTTITVNPLPTAAIAVAETSGTTNNDGTICAGASSTLTASGGTSYIWSTAATTAGISVTPTGTTTYTVTVTNTNGCTDTEVTTITVNPLPTAAIAVAETSGTTNNDGIICAGASATLTASGGTSYVWSTAATTAGISVTPTGTTTYTVTVTNTNGCTDTEVTTITVNPLPTAAISIAETSGTTNNDGIICAGASATLTASGGTSYVWSTAATTAGISVNPTGTTTYTVTVTNMNGCTDTEVTTITVNPLPATPTITITNNVCPSTIGTISATGCGSGTLEWATNAAGPWSTTVPTYTTSAFTVYARCVENGCIGATANATTAPITCSGSPSTLVQSITTCPQTGIENFDTFAGTLASIPLGWATSSADFTPGGYYTNTGTYSNSNSTYALGTSSDAAYGAKVATSGLEATNTLTYCMTNNTGQTINSINVTWDVEQYSIADRATTIDLTYNVNGGAYGQVGISGTSLTTASIQSPASTADANLANIIVTPRNVTFTNTVLPTQQFCIRLTIQNGAGSWIKCTYWI